MRAREGYTLIELLVTVSLIAILTSVAIPGFLDLVRDSRATSTVNRFVAAIQYARSQAIKSGRVVVMCKTGGKRACDAAKPWHAGWMLFEDLNRSNTCRDNDRDGYCDKDGGRIALIGEPLPDGFRIIANGNTAKRLRFSPLGSSPGYMGTFSFCDTSGIASPRGVSIIGTGRPLQLASDHPNLKCP